jgi:hypothetical protein
LNKTGEPPSDLADAVGDGEPFALDPPAADVDDAAAAALLEASALDALASDALP